MEKNREKQVILGIKEGGSNADAALKTIYREYFDMIRKMIHQKGGNEVDAKDVFQESVIALYQFIRKDHFRADASIKTILYSIARNLWHNQMRKLKITEDLSVYSETKGEEAVYFDYDEFNKQQVIRKLIDQLSGDCKKIIHFFYYDKKSMEAIRNEMELSSIKVTKNKKYRCMKHLMKLFKEQNLDRSDFSE